MDVLDLLEARGFIKESTGIESLRKTMNEGRITYYVGFDPTADSLHVGHMLPVMAMAWLQRAGHRPIVVLGGGTAMVGDPSGKTEMRTLISQEQILENAEGMKQQLSHFLEFGDDSGEMVNNADWLLNLNYISFLRDVGRHFSVNRMLAAEAYKLRLERGLSFIEFNYQLLQAYDFLELHRQYGCTLQMGGDDQWGNILAGTDLIRRVVQGDAHGLTFPLITTAAGAKMGKTAKGAVWLDPKRMSVFDFYQYWLNVDDRDVIRLMKLYTFLPLEEIAPLERLEGAEIRKAKRVLAHEVTTLVHGVDAAKQAAEAAQAMVSGQANAELPTFDVDGEALTAGVKIYAVLADAKVCSSRSDARRQIKGGAVKIGTDRITDLETTLPADLDEEGVVVRVGKKRAVRVRRNS
jgi:tyrosyl-tRNA synthetase